MNQMKKEELEITISDSDRIECAIRHIQTAVDVDPWAVEIAVKAMKTQLSAEGTTSDLISRQDAIEVIEEMQMPIMRSMFPEEQFVFKGMSEALSAIKDLPSAHPEIQKRKEESAQNVPKEDLISRKAAIEALGERPMVWTDDDQYALGERNQYDMNRLAIETLPSAQPEPLVKESRTLVKDLVKDTISRQAAIDALVKAIRKDPYYDSNEAINGLGVCDVRVILNDLPSAQPEIIRCKDCKHHHYEKDIPYCDRIDYGYGWKNNDYCSRAERRTDE